MLCVCLDRPGWAATRALLRDLAQLHVGATVTLLNRSTPAHVMDPVLAQLHQAGVLFYNQPFSDVSVCSQLALRALLSVV
jgi:hypothetical protein